VAVDCHILIEVVITGCMGYSAAMRNLEAVLTTLVDRVSPGAVRLGIPKHA
jgi:hypothetical protein